MTESKNQELVYREINYACGHNRDINICCQPENLQSIISHLQKNPCPECLTKLDSVKPKQHFSQRRPVPKPAKTYTIADHLRGNERKRMA